jgi:tRNASer (uridine44-2'-O)-methyltransferase
LAAAYLLLLWEEERRTTGLTDKQTFIDLGCGNGLLVYILTCEGHRGVGVDIRCGAEGQGEGVRQRANE